MSEIIISKNLIESKIILIRNERVIMANDLAVLYGVTVKRLNEQVKRNIERFPNDFVFQLTKNELKEVVANCDRFNNLKHSSVPPYVFTEQGVAMLSSVLNSVRAIKTNIAIMRFFVLTRKMSFSYDVLDKRLSLIEKKYGKQDDKIDDILNTIKFLIKSNINNTPKIIKGFEIKK